MTLLTKAPGAYVSPEGNKPPPFKALWVPLMTATGTTTGSTTPSGFVGILGDTEVTNADPWTLTKASGSLEMHVNGGVTFTASNAESMFTLLPTGDAADFCADILDLATYDEGETLMVGVEMETPAGWAAASASTFALLSTGDFTGTGGAMRFMLASNESPAFGFVAVGASAAGTSVVGLHNLGPMVENDRNAVIWELTCISPNIFKVRAHTSNNPGDSSSGDWQGDFDLSDPTNGGTAAPGIGSTPRITIGCRYNTAASNNQDLNVKLGETLRNVWFARFGEEPIDGTGPRACDDMLLRRGKFPRAIRYYTGLDPFADVSDGNWTTPIGVITGGDMFVAIAPERDFDLHPKYTAVTSAFRVSGPLAGQAVNAASTKMLQSPFQTHYSAVANPPGFQHIEDPAQGTKFGRSTTGPDGLGPAILCASHYTDISSNRKRCEVGFRGDDVIIPMNTTFWVGIRAWWDFTMDDDGQQHAVICQFHSMIRNLYTNTDGTRGLNPNMAISLYPTKLKATVWASTAIPTLKVDSVYEAETTAPTRGAWFDVVIQARLAWQTSQGPFLKVWLNGTQFATYSGITMYRPTEDQPQARELRFGIYPGNRPHSPVVKRPIWIKRSLMCLNVGNYTAAQIRAALTATITEFPEA